MPSVTTRFAPLIATPRLPWDSCNMRKTLARRVAVNSACGFNRVPLVAGSRTVNTIRLYIMRHYLNITSRDIYGTRSDEVRRCGDAML